MAMKCYLCIGDVFMMRLPFFFHLLIFKTNIYMTPIKSKKRNENPNANSHLYTSVANVIIIFISTSFTYSCRTFTKTSKFRTVITFLWASGLN